MKTQSAKPPVLERLVTTTVMWHAAAVGLLCTSGLATRFHEMQPDLNVPNPFTDSTTAEHALNSWAHVGVGQSGAAFGVAAAQGVSKTMNGNLSPPAVAGVAVATSTAANVGTELGQAQAFRYAETAHLLAPANIGENSRDALAAMVGCGIFLAIENRRGIASAVKRKMVA